MSGAVATMPADLAEWSQRKRARARSPNTQRAYRQQWDAFCAWCLQAGRASLPASPATLIEHLRHIENTLALSSIKLRLAAIARAHRDARQLPAVDDPRVRDVWAGFQREHARAPRRAWSLTTDDVRKMLAQCTDDVAGDRDAALLLVAFVGGLRRSELVGVNVEDITWRDRGAVIAIGRRKNDQLARGTSIAIPYLQPATCPARHLKRWLAEGGITSGAVFRGVGKNGYSLTSERLDTSSVARIVKRLAAAAGLDAARYSGHSLRAGFATSAKRGGAAEGAIARGGGWSSVDMLSTYIRTADPFEDCAAYSLGL